MIVFVIFLAIGLGIVFGTKSYLSNYGGLYALYIGIFLIDAVFFFRSVYYLTMKVSFIEMNSPTA
jgi:hypothetical protein